MTTCNARKHNLDVVGTTPVPPSRLKRSPNAQPRCRGCEQERWRGVKAGVRRKWELPEVFDLDTGMQIIDEVAISRAVGGGRLWAQEATGIQPWITETEARIAAGRMLDRGMEPEWIADNIGCAVADVYLWTLGAVPADVAVAA